MDKSLQTRLVFVCVLAVLIPLSGLHAYAEERITDIDTVLETMKDQSEGYSSEDFDSNSDGKTDYHVVTDRDGNKIFETLDFNHDGTMDDLYFYSDGKIERREIDSNFDGRIDVWVYIRDGRYITKYEQDLDFDGVIDKTRVFTEGDED